MRTTAATVLSCFLAFVAPAFAQTQITTGVIQGSVTDATNAALPGVTVEARNTGTNLSRVLTTGNDGRFVFLQLPSGTYTVTYTLAGFATLVQEMSAHGGAVGHVIGQMTVSTLAETVRVTDREAACRDDALSAVASTLNQTTVEQTPISAASSRISLTLTPRVSVVQGPDGDRSRLPDSAACSTTSASTAATSTTAFFGERSAASAPRSTSRLKRSRSSR